MAKKVFFSLCLCFFALGLAVLPVNFAQFGLRADILPDLPFCAVFFFAVHSRLGAFYVFIYGLFVSELYGNPLGLESLLFVITYATCSRYRAVLLSKQPFSLYSGFAAVAALYGLSKFILLSLYYGHLFDYARVLMQIFTTVLFYPSVDFVMGKIRG